MGTVYLGQNSEGRRAAIKVVAANLAADSTFRRRFKREVEVCRQVAGHQVAELIDSDVDAERPLGSPSAPWRARHCWAEFQDQGHFEGEAQRLCRGRC